MTTRMSAPAAPFTKAAISSLLSGAMPRSIGSPGRSSGRAPTGRPRWTTRSGPGQSPRRAARARRRWRNRHARAPSADGQGGIAHIAAARAMARASRSRPARSRTWPARKSRPARRTRTGPTRQVRARRGLVIAVALRILLDQRIASAPSGTGAPVKIRTHLPGPSEPAKRSPARWGRRSPSAARQPPRRRSARRRPCPSGGGGKGRAASASGWPRCNPSTRPPASDQGHRSWEASRGTTAGEQLPAARPSTGRSGHHLSPDRRAELPRAAARFVENVHLGDCACRGRQPWPCRRG